MDRRRRSERDAVSPTPTRRPPAPAATPSSFLRDVSNFRTPKSRILNPNPRPPSSPLPISFTASKKTPSSISSTASRRRGTSVAATASRSEASCRRLKALELEQSQSSRKNQVRREKALKSFSGSISAWLNFLFKNPSSCGCHTSPWSRDRQDGMASSGKRESYDDADCGMGVGGHWRSPKRQRDCSWRGASDNDAVRRETAIFSSLKVSLKDICSLEDTKERMKLYMSEKSCKEALFMMNQVCKSIDEGRLKIKANCPLVTDLGLKEKATRTLMCYNPMWLRIGLYIIFGGDSLLVNEEEKSDLEFRFLKMILETQFFSHVDIAKSYAYNKLVEGLYKPGYYEALGSIILKRFLLLVISLDKAKCECTLPTKYGIDGVDGGSPLLFCHHSHIKSSQQVISEFLSDVMHGEGNLLAHLLTLGFKVNHRQVAISEYDFNVKNLFGDVQDGIRLSRVIQLLEHDASILSKLMAPPDTRKKKLHNCTNAMKYLKQAGVSLCDAEGTQILSEDIVNGDKELTLSILWNIFVGLQVPLLIDRASLVAEIIKLKRSHMGNPDYSSVTMIGLLLEWIQVVCESYDIKFDGVSSLVDGKALCCLIHHYSDANFQGIFPSQDYQEGKNKCVLRHFGTKWTAGFHNLVLVQRVITMIGNFPELLRLSDLRDGDSSLDERSMIILLTFLASLLICRKDLDPGKMCSLMRGDWTPDMTPSASSWSLISENDLFTKSLYWRKTMLKISPPLKKRWLDKSGTEEWAVRVIQAHFRRFVARDKFLKIKNATCILQSAIRAWLTVVFGRKLYDVRIGRSVSLSYFGQYDTYMKFLTERHKFIHIKKSVQLIQTAVRAWILRRHQMAAIADSGGIEFSYNQSEPIYAEWESLHQQAIAATRIQNVWRGFTLRKYLLVIRYATIKIQSHWRAWCTRMNYLTMIKSATKIQAYVRRMLCVKSFKCCSIAATVIQRFTRGHLARNRLLGASSLRSSNLRFRLTNMTNSSVVKHLQLNIVIFAVLRIQRWWKQIILSRRQTMAVIFVQSFVRGWRARKATNKMWLSISMIQKWWRFILFRQLRRRSVLIIQAHVRGWIARRATAQDKHSIVVIQSYWRGYLVRKHSRQQLFNLQCELKNLQADVDTELINRLVAALSELNSCKSISSLRHTCAMLSSATEYSQRCCETLVAAGAIAILLRLVRTLNRGVPDQEVMKYVLSALRNIVHYPLLLQAFLNVPCSGEIIFQEVLRSKNDGYFLACDLLKKLCSVPEGHGKIRILQNHIRRLNILVQDYERKVEVQKM
ncbi:abnormal spindle-like microcephaly-associated protein [Canna indica]|uniref:Abnormal spindle-like microcephaly-associated protein n=1 Tax=Canna indica TaxID=4628 RepID=A0AAQ3JL88_9LILI|nr:abnormal spindle-like microcephaly-associated protein [Canna indica]